MSDENLDQETANDDADIEQMLAGLDAAAGEGETAAPGKNAPPELPLDAAISLLLGAGFEILAPNWKVTGVEVKQLSEAYAALAEKYIPEGSFGVEISALLVTAMVIGPRIRTPRVIQASNDAPGQDNNQDADAA